MYLPLFSIDTCLIVLQLLLNCRTYENNKRLQLILQITPFLFHLCLILFILFKQTETRTHTHLATNDQSIDPMYIQRAIWYPEVQSKCYDLMIRRSHTQ